MKKMFFAMILAVAAWPALAQETNSQSQPKNTCFAAEALVRATGTFQKEMSGATDVEVAFGLRTGRWLIDAPVTATMGRFNRTSTSWSSRGTYESLGAAGLGVGFNLAKDIRKPSMLMVRGGVSLGDNNWRYTYYDVEYRRHHRFQSNYRNVMWGVGLRYYDTYKGPVKDCIALSLSFGLGWF